MQPFFKLSGGGNDFVALAEPDVVPDPATIRHWCHRGISIGADGVFVLRRAGEALALQYWNSDGGEAALCLNAARCAVRLAAVLGWGAPPFRIETGAGPLIGNVVDAERTSIEAPAPDPPPTLHRLDTEGRTFDGWLTRVGVPHLVVFMETPLQELDVAWWGSRLRSHSELDSQGANVDFVEIEGSDRMSLRSFERGIEGETLACGTGMVAAAAAGVAAGRTGLPIRVTTRGGFEFEIRTEEKPNSAQRWFLAGDARLVAQGRLADATSGPRPC